MEGVLWKWTNYLSGWQPRWFVLDNGVLSYYKSQEDVNNGCKGSIKMTVCDIVVHPTDAARLDLIIHGEQHYYVKAATTKERQEWLVALGSAKAMLNNSGRAADSIDEVSPGSLRSKKSELRLYCDLLMQQVHSVKQAVKTDQTDTQKLDEATSLLTATCDTFIQTLEDCMQLAKHVSSPGPTDLSPSPSSPTRTNRKGSRNVSRSNSVEKSVHPKLSPMNSYDGVTPLRPRTRPRSGSESSFSESELTNGTVRPRSITSDSNVIYEVEPVREESGDGADKSEKSVGVSDSSDTQPKPVLSLKHKANSEEHDGLEDFKDAIDSKIPTFFSVMKPSVTDIRVLPNNGVPVEPFLGACRSIVPIFDKLNGTAFAPVKMDFAGNIRKIQQKYSTNSDSFATLQDMVVYEVKAKQHTNSNSATVAILWLKRGLEFILEFMREVCSGQLDLTVCASNAYSRSLKPFHGWVVRGVFAVAVKALPYRDVFLSQLAEVECDTESSSYQHSLSEDCEVFIRSLSFLTRIITDFYVSHDLDSAEQV
ncbi:pleckstrin homology domain-containing family A member 8-like [Haliotis asinina]|uniref:pleckstrin homology domain-containing family A member 8-like n=1 Tax=Haliotis asinina TaxID=109174 RepID=UPI0035325D48